MMVAKQLTAGEKISRDLCEMDAPIDNIIEVDPVDVARRIDEENHELLQQLAIAEEHNARLREALTASDSLLRDLPNSGGFYGLAVMEANEQALSIPASTEALDKYVSEKVKDSESRTGNQSPCYTIARDIAVRMWEKHYKTDAPNWEPLDDFMGVLSQISNMLTGLGNVEKITRQRDLAISAATKARNAAQQCASVCSKHLDVYPALLNMIDVVDCALAAIKESEV